MAASEGGAEGSRAACRPCYRETGATCHPPTAPRGSWTGRIRLTPRVRGTRARLPPPSSCGTIAAPRAASPPSARHREREREKERSHSDEEHGCLREGRQAHTAHRAETRKARPLRDAPMVLRNWCPALSHGSPYAPANVSPCLPSPYTRTPHGYSSGSVDPGATAGGAGAVGGASEPRLCPSVAAQPRIPCKSP